MKHTSKVTIILVTFFLLTQIVALFLVSGEVQPNITLEENQTVVSINSTLITEVPANIFDWKAILYLGVGISLGTGLILLLRKLSFGGKLWKLWYFLAVYVAINFALKLLFSLTAMTLASITLISSIIALVLAFLKIRNHNFYIHNITEMLMYSGIGTFIVILFNNNVLFVSILLLLIAIYDMIAVWKSGHMIKLAKFTTENKLFPGFAMNYDSKKGSTKIITKDIRIDKKTSDIKSNNKKTRQAILGGGDVVFPIIFSGVVLGWLFNKGFTRMQSFGLSLITTIFAATALYLLFYYSKKDKFYPAMPFIATGCYVGFGVLYLILLFL